MIGLIMCIYNGLKLLAITGQAHGHCTYIATQLQGTLVN